MNWLGLKLAWIEICLANRLTAAGRRWADIALRRYGHFSGRISQSDRGQQ